MDHYCHSHSIVAPGLFVRYNYYYDGPKILLVGTFIMIFRYMY